MEYIYCNAELLRLVSQHKVKLLEVSKVLFDEYWLSYAVASFDSLKELEKISEKKCEEKDAWWREIGHANISVEDHTPRIARQEGLLIYICDKYGASTEKNVAAMIGSIAWHEGKNPIELFNSFDKL